MSIKKLFGSVEDGRNYLSDTDQKDAFKDIESERNLEQLKRKQSEFVPQVDYSDPRTFAKFGSAYYYYKGGMDRITDYYPYDGSDAEINEFYNKLLDVEKYVFNKLYPRTNGYVKLSEATTTAVSNVLEGYSIPSTKEYIALKAGPHAVAGTASLVQASNNPYADKFQYSNVYDTDIYTTEGLPSSYGVGTRESNLQSNFDTGVSIEFWLKKPNFMASETAGNKETIFDLWTSGSHSGSSDYGRITLELTGGVDGSPFLLTVQSGSAVSAVGLFQQSIGASTLTTGSLATWNHFAFVMYNTGSDFVSRLYVNGTLNDINATRPAATATIVGTAALSGEAATDFKLVNADGTVITFTTNAAKNFGDTVDETASPFTVNTGGDFSSDGIRKATQAFWISCKAAIDNGVLDCTIDPTTVDPVAAGQEYFTLTQTTAGTDGNTAITLITGVTANGETGFTGGANLNLGALKQKDVFGRIGALITAPSGAAEGSVEPAQFDGVSKLSASMDEFRFWKEKRTGEDIGRYWFTQVRGGSNTDISNTTLGVYYKFNEGITETASIDSNVLDYSGRISNGNWVGYGTNSRFTGSAIVESSASIKEYKDPIIYAKHPSVSFLKGALLDSGSYHDSQNNSQFVNYAPSWVIEEHEEAGNTNLALISHIVGSYFDRIYLLAEQIPKLQGVTYTSASVEPVPFAEHMPQSLGLYTPQLFIDANVMERFLNRNEDSVFEGDLNETKNLIYLNLYNNLANIYKSKGTEKALRNVLRCFNVDEKLIKVNTYAHNTTFPLNNNYEQVIENRRFINFDRNRQANIYQRIVSNSAGNNQSSGHISASIDKYERKYGATVEAEVTFPYWGQEEYIQRPREYTKVSLFGIRTPATGSMRALEGIQTYTNDPDYTNLQVYAIKPSNDSHNAYFLLTSSFWNDSVTTRGGIFPTLSSSVFYNIYDNTTWNLSVRIRPKVDDTNLIGSGIEGTDPAAYEVIFEGHEINMGFSQNKFAVSASMNVTSGSNFLSNPKRLFVGAERQNITGSLLASSDVLFGAARYWAKSLKDGTILQHAFDIDNYGISGSYENVAAIDSKNAKLDVLNLNALALNWTFGQVTGSNAAGNFVVMDMSSGSSVERTQRGTMGKISGYQHTGYGYGFLQSNTDVGKKRQVNTYKFIEPERATSADAIQILSEDDKVFGVVETVPNYVYTVEKSMYRAISEEMLDFFAGVVDFNNLIGAPVNRYRGRYKSIEKLRESFFRRVTKTSQVEKFVEYYKWFDDAISQIMGQLVPASSDFVTDVYNTVESHVLERNKYQTQYPTLESKPPGPDGQVFGVGELGYPYVQGSSTLSESPRPTNKHIEFWKKRALRSSPEITSDNTIIDAQREKYRKVAYSAPYLPTKYLTVAKADGGTYVLNTFAQRNFQQLYKLKPIKLNENLIHGGVNFDQSKNIQFTYNALYPFGPVSRADNRFIPLNVLMGLTSDIVQMQDFLDNRDLRKKVKRVFDVQHGRNWDNGEGYSNVKSTVAFPFNILSSSLKSGYNKEVVDRTGLNIEITNLHNDIYGAAMDIPMQGPFTEKYVGGHQSRHITYNSGGTDTYLTRPEAWKLLLGQCPDQGSGAIGMASPTYPYPDIGAPPSSSVGTVKIVNTLGIGDYVTIGDGESSIKFKIPFENDKAMLFQDEAGSLVALSGDASASFGLPSDHPLDYYFIEKGTITAWVSASATTGTGWIFAAGLSHGIMAFGYRADNKLHLYQQWYDGATGGNVNVDYRTDAAAITDGVWHHVAVTYDATLTGAMDPKFFVDGVLQASAVYTPVPTAAGSTLQLKRKVEGLLGASARVITAIGGSGNATVTVSGALDEVSIWQLSMSADQITELYATGSVLNLKSHSAYLDNSTNLYSWYRMGDDANDAINGSGNYDLGDNSIVDQTGRANGNPRDVSSPAMSFTTNVITASADPDTFTTWTKGGTVSDTAQNLTDAVNASSLNINASKGIGSWLTLANTKYGVADSSKRSARGSLGNVTIIASASSDQIWPFGMSGGVDPVILNFNAPRATYYRDFVAKSPVNIRNIQMKTGSTIIGNYQYNYEVVNIAGGFDNPRAFIKNQPTLPSIITSQTNLNRGGEDNYEGRSSQVVLNYLARKRTSGSHFDFELDYTVTENSGTFNNKSVIISRFSAPGSRETMARGFQDYRSSEFSVYNTLNYRNLTVLNAGQANEKDAQTRGSGYIVNDIHNRPFGLNQHLTRHAQRFGRDTLAVTGRTFAEDGPGASYDQLPAYQKANRNPIKKIVQKSDGTYVTASIFDNYYVQHQIPRSDRQYLWITSSLVSEKNHFRYLPADYLVSNSSGYTEPYEFLTASMIGSYEASASAASLIGSSGSWFYPVVRSLGTAYGQKNFIPTDFVGLNTNIYEPLSSSVNVLGYSSTRKINEYENSPIKALQSNTQPPDAPDALINPSAEVQYNLLTDFYSLNPTSSATYRYTGSANLRGWWRFNADIAAIGYVPDSSGFDRDGKYKLEESSAFQWLPKDITSPPYMPTLAPASPGRQQNGSIYVNPEFVNYPAAGAGSIQIGSASMWDRVITGSTGRISLSCWLSRPGNMYLTHLWHFGSGSSAAGLRLQLRYDGDLLVQTTYDGGTYTKWLWDCPSWSTDCFLNQYVDPPNWGPGANHAIWRNIVITFDPGGSNEPILYIDAVSQSVKSRSGTYPPNPGVWDGLYPGGDMDCRINSIPGATNASNGPAPLQMADFAIWNETLSSGTVESLFHASSGAFATPTGKFDNEAAENQILNSLLIHRNGPYGWPTWKQIRYDNPLTRYEHKNNKLSVYTPGTGDDGTDFKSFDLTPVSMRGRPAKINFDGPGTQDTTFIATSNNMEIFFKSPVLNNMVGVNYEEITTPLEQLIDITKDNATYSPNWILYSQNLYPSTRNELESHATQRTDYDNKFWRRTQSERVTLGSSLKNSFGIPAEGWTTFIYGAQDAGGKPLMLTQSSWPLDAPSNFLTRNSLTRTFPPQNVEDNKNWARQIDSGELQNLYVMTPQYPQTNPAFVRFDKRSLGALYSRKQTLGSVNSVLGASSGMNISSGSLTGTFDTSEQITCFSGEAYWDAPANAGINIKSGNTFIFESHPSEPWFNTYEDFRQDLKLKAKDYSIVPEFRISEHVSDFRKYGLFDNNNADIFEIPGTGINSANNKKFYLDYSNSEFLKGFLNIKEKSLMNATEIKLVCEAAIRFNPYKGFYPVQRAMDLVSQWSSSYFDSLSIIRIDQGGFEFATASVGPVLLSPDMGGTARAVVAPLFAPGILFNSIKSGMAVDYPVIVDSSKVLRFPFASASLDMVGDMTSKDKSNTTALTINPEGLKTSDLDTSGYNGKTFWDKRLPFEAIINPENHMANLQLMDLESNPSCSLIDIEASLTAVPVDNLYSLMASNYFAEIGNFFLDRSKFTKLESRVITEKLSLTSGSAYAARITLRRSTTGPRNYQYELDSDGKTYAASGVGSQYRNYGGTGPNNISSFVSTGPPLSSSYFPLPQDPRFSPEFKETFTLYSRPTAFGPPVAALRQTGALGNPNSASTANLTAMIITEEDVRRPQDSFNGYNWSFTPPYYDGEAWADVVFFANRTGEYTPEEILVSASIQYWRYDSGTANMLGFTGSISGSYIESSFGIYNGSNINNNAMQLSASVNLFGIEKVQFTEKDKFDNISTTRNIVAGTKWVIETKFETPHTNFNDVFQSTAISRPSFASESVPYGIWHQFGKIPTDPNVGVFLEIGDIPEQWQKYHPEMTLQSGIYNDNGANPRDSKTFKSLADMFGFKTEEKSKRLGEIADHQILREAIVAIPYITDTVEGEYTEGAVSNEETKQLKKFINIPKQRFEAALKDREGSVEGDTLQTAGESIRKLIQKMERYVLPPQFDFLQNKDIDPIAMYIFEFEYKLDKDDLSYIWQNLAPRNYKKLTFQKSSVAHELMDTELLSQANVLDNENLRWMVFKVKQKSQVLYEDMVTGQVGEASRAAFLQEHPGQRSGYKVAYNWPYDYVSFVEMVKIDAQVLYGGRSNGVSGNRVSPTDGETSPVLETPGTTTPTGLTGTSLGMTTPSIFTGGGDTGGGDTGGGDTGGGGDY